MTRRATRSPRRDTNGTPKTPRKPPARTSPRSKPAITRTQWESLWPALIVWGIAAALAYYVGQTHWYIAWLLGGSISLFSLYMFDKQRAREGGRRVPEVVLKWLALAGGVLGGWLGMLGLRHKTQHPEFWTVQWAATAIHAILALLILRS